MVVLGSRPVDGEGSNAESLMVMARREERRTILGDLVGHEGLPGVCLSV